MSSSLQAIPFVHTPLHKGISFLAEPFILAPQSYPVLLRTILLLFVSIQLHFGRKINKIKILPHITESQLSLHNFLFLFYTGTPARNMSFSGQYFIFFFFTLAFGLPTILYVIFSIYACPPTPSLLPLIFIQPKAIYFTFADHSIINTLKKINK